MRIDLHIHSRLSDGEDSISELVTKIKSSGLDVFALTDHDRTDGWAEAAELAVANGLSFIPGVEITTEGRAIDENGEMQPFGVHLLAYLPDPNNQELQELLLANRNSRIIRTQKFVDRIAVDYPELTFDLVESIAETDSTLGRPDIARALIELGLVASVDEAFRGKDQQLGILSKRNEKYYVPNSAPFVIDVIALVRKAGGVPVIAHPLARTSSEDEQPESFPRANFVAMAEAGLLGLETSHLEVSPATKIVLDEFAAEFGLITTGSSDYHGLTTKENNPLGLYTTSLEMLKRIVAAGTGTTPTLSNQL
jgi:hypothetical protein